MGGFGYVCALVLAAVFVRAAVVKLARPGETDAGFAALHLPAARMLARIVPVVELALSVTLIVVPRAGGGAALVLLAGFTAVLVRAIASGVTAPCNCFGAARRTPISRVDIIRNVVLAGLAVAALFATTEVV
ncbi:MAG TPA: MauE/DoxX family redox-associated membrane protein [Acidimicrobiales bacterium]|nr:MauE/DoxX family redox-associated membrane protein [Acidimicrobiales bacterium]